MTLPRFRIRTLMIAVAVVAAALGIVERPYRFRRIADHHQAEFYRLVPMLRPSIRWDVTDPVTRRLEYHEGMRRKYERAARRPWVPVPPDPPEPK